MSKRRSPTRSFKPQSDHLEKLAGASSLAIGEFADVALALGGGFAFAQPTSSVAEMPAADPRFGSQAQRPRPASISPIMDLDAITPTTRADIVRVSHVTAAPTPTIPMPVTPSAGVIRPLALAPTPQPITMKIPPPMASGNPAGGGGGGGRTSPVITAAGGGGGGLPLPDLSAGAGAPTRLVMAPMTGGGGGGSSQPNITAGSSFRGTNSTSGYVATGGGTSTRYAGEFAPDDSGDPQIQNAGTIPGTSTAATVLTPGNFTYTPASGGSQPIPETLNIINNSSGGSYVGSVASFSVTSSVGTLTNISWNVSGATPAYTGNTFSNTPGALQWTHPPYSPPPGQAGSNANSSISFDWGEKPGADTVTVTANVVIPPGSGTIQGAPEATASVTVASPSVFWVLDYEPEARAPGPLLTYSYMNNNGTITPGINWAFSNYNAGSEAVEQLMTNASLKEATDSSANPAASWSGPKDADGNPAPFPLVDMSSNATLPWYDSTPATGTDSPTLPVDKPNAAYASMDEYFTDDVMYNPGGIFVPVAQFTWQIEATATESGSTWSATTFTAGPDAMPTTSTAWPQTAMAYPANDYSNLT